ncbi:heparinase II/III family protein [Thiorhodococcus minor]|uniref:Heparin-sulfate lyase N-terminal domain-containing protein n=1 Tax=Thiorhodococcus minor TaxID=57489 RepID=A0A6M0K8K8_9GAMM|nr:heparinase II/III family protein [Thiorhodococcus minor]NEV65057.1 hypothetical protein [Thiorhodococcus minor]
MLVEARVFALVLRAMSRVGLWCLDLMERCLALRRPTYASGVSIDPSLFPRYFTCPDRENVPGTELTFLRDISVRYLRHEFDLLGSGWMKVGRRTVAKGLRGIVFDYRERFPADGLVGVNLQNRSEALRIWNVINKEGYEPIHWHLAYKSGYAWDPKMWRTQVRSRLPLGVDLKEPWELSRMQHLPVLAVYACWDPEIRDLAVAEIESEVLDFVANNPPGFSVNWACTMDVALRSCSWLITYDLARGAGAKWRSEFLEVFGRSLYEHARFIARHLEWSDLTRGNHYFVDIVGLLFSCAYLPRTTETEGWLDFSIREFIKELDRQFNPDGTSIEASTCYHCFMSEVAIYSVSLLVAMLRRKGSHSFQLRSEGLVGFLAKRVGLATFGQSGVSLSSIGITSSLTPDLLTQLHRMGAFSAAIKRPDGSILNIGDCDSAFFTRIGCRYNAGPYEGSFGPELFDLSREHVVGLINDFLYGGSSHWVSGILPAKLEYSLPAGMTPGQEERSPESSWIDRKSGRFSYRIPLHRSPQETPLSDYYFDFFGLYILKNDTFFISVRGIPKGRQIRSHRHADEVSVCLFESGQQVIEDPGMPFYTPFPLLASLYRGRFVHWGPQFLSAKELRSVKVRPYKFGIEVARRERLLLSVEVGRDRIMIESDFLIPAFGSIRSNFVPLSNGYGKRAHL